MQIFGAMMTRAEQIMVKAGLTRVDLAAALGCDTSTISRLFKGRDETSPQRLLLDHLARQKGLHHLTSDSFAACPPPQAAEEAPAAPPGGGGHSVSETDGAPA